MLGRIADEHTNTSITRPATYTKPLQKLVDETRRFGHLPKWKKVDSAADRYERNLRMRLWRQKENLPEALSCFLQDKAEEWRSRVQKRVQKLVDETTSFGRLPKQKKGDSAADRYENNLYSRLYRQKVVATRQGGRREKPGCETHQCREGTGTLPERKQQG